MQQRKCHMTHEFLLGRVIAIYSFTTINIHLVGRCDNNCLPCYYEQTILHSFISVCISLYVNAGVVFDR